MLKIVRQRLDVYFEGQQAAELQRQVDQSLHPLISGVRREYFKRLGLPADEVEKWLERYPNNATSPLILGDVVLRDADTVMYYRAPREERWLEAGVITRKDPGAYADFFDDLLKIAKKTAERKDLAWTPACEDDDLAASLAGESVAAVPTGAEVEASRELETDAAQRVIREILDAGSVFLTKFNQTLTQDRAVIDRLMQRFEDLGLVSKDFAVLCRKTGQQILRVSSRAAIEDPSQKTFKCFICGNPVSGEQLDEIITVTDFGRKLLEHDHWLVVRALGAMESAGIPNQKVWVHAEDGNLTNLFVSVNDQLYLFVLANRKIALEESSLINAHIAAYRLTHVIVISTQRVSTLMRNHLEKSNPGCEVDFIDALADVDENLRAILIRKEKAMLRQVLENFSTLTPVRVQDAVMERFSPSGEPVEGEKKTKSPSTEKPARRGKAAREDRPQADPDAEEGEFLGEVLSDNEETP